MEGVFPHEVFQIFGIPIRDTVLHTWILMGAFILLAYLFNRYSRLRPRAWQMPFEAVVEFAVKLVEDMIGPHAERYLPLIGTLVLFIASASVLGIFPALGSPTRDINTTFALAVVVFIAVHYYGIQEHGAGGYLKHLMEPNVIVFVLNIIGQFSRTLSLTVRLFGNIIASEMIVAVIFVLVPAGAAIPLQLLGMFTALLQAYVFTVLTCTYIRSAVESSSSNGNTDTTQFTSLEKE